MLVFCDIYRKFSPGNLNSHLEIINDPNDQGDFIVKYGLSQNL